MMIVYFRKTEMRVNHLGANLGPVTEQSFWLQVWDTVSYVRDASGLHHQGRELGLGWRCRQSHGGGGVAGEHGGRREEKQEPSKKFGLWFHWKRPWIPNSGVWIWWCTQCCCENVVGEQMKLFPAGCYLVVQFMSASCNTLR